MSNVIFHKFSRQDVHLIFLVTCLCTIASVLTAPYSQRSDIDNRVVLDDENLWQTGYQDQAQEDNKSIVKENVVAVKKQRSPDDDTNKHWYDAARTLFQKWGYKDEDLPEPFGSGHPSATVPLTPEFKTILKGLIEKVPPELEHDIQNILKEKIEKTEEVPKAPATSAPDNNLELLNQEIKRLEELADKDTGLFEEQQRKALDEEIEKLQTLTNINHEPIQLPPTQLEELNKEIEKIQTLVEQSAPQDEKQEVAAEVVKDLNEIITHLEMEKLNEEIKKLEALTAEKDKSTTLNEEQKHSLTDEIEELHKVNEVTVDEIKALDDEIKKLEELTIQSVEEDHKPQHTEEVDAVITQLQQLSHSIQVPKKPHYVTFCEDKDGPCTESELKQSLHAPEVVSASEMKFSPDNVNSGFHAETVDKSLAESHSDVPAEKIVTDDIQVIDHLIEEIKTMLEKSDEYQSAKQSSQEYLYDLNDRIRELESLAMNCARSGGHMNPHHETLESEIDSKSDDMSMNEVADKKVEDVGKIINDIDKLAKLERKSEQADHPMQASSIDDQKVKTLENVIKDLHEMAVDEEMLGNIGRGENKKRLDDVIYELEKDKSSGGPDSLKLEAILKDLEKDSDVEFELQRRLHKIDKTGKSGHLDSAIADLEKLTHEAMKPSTARKFSQKFEDDVREVETHGFEESGISDTHHRMSFADEVQNLKEGKYHHSAAQLGDLDEEIRRLDELAFQSQGLLTDQMKALDEEITLLEEMNKVGKHGDKEALDREITKLEHITGSKNRLPPARLHQEVNQEIENLHNVIDSMSSPKQQNYDLDEEIRRIGEIAEKHEQLFRSDQIKALDEEINLLEEMNKSGTHGDKEALDREITKLEHMTNTRNRLPPARLHQEVNREIDNLHHVINSMSSMHQKHQKDGGDIIKSLTHIQDEVAAAENRKKVDDVIEKLEGKSHGHNNGKHIVSQFTVGKPKPIDFDVTGQNIDKLWGDNGENENGKADFFRRTGNLEKKQVKAKRVKVT